MHCWHDEDGFGKDASSSDSCSTGPSTEADNVYRGYQPQLFPPHVVAWDHSAAETPNQHYLTVNTQLYTINLPPYSALCNKHTEFPFCWCISIRVHSPPDPGFPVPVPVISLFLIAWVSSVRSILNSWADLGSHVSKHLRLMGTFLI